MVSFFFVLFSILGSLLNKHSFIISSSKRLMDLAVERTGRPLYRTVVSMQQRALVSPDPAPRRWAAPMLRPPLQGPHIDLLSAVLAQGRGQPR